MQELGIDVLNSSKTIKWDDQEISKCPRDITVSEMMQMNEDPPAVQAEAKRISNILDAKYEPANLNEVVKEIPEMSDDDKKELLKLLKKYEILFDGQLGNWASG